MDHGTFDTIARRAAEMERRTAIRLLAGSVAVALAARFGLAGHAAAKGRRHQRDHQPDKGRERPLQASTRKKKGKKKHKPHKPPVTEFSCNDARCRLIAVDTDELDTEIGSCVADGTILSVCGAAKNNQHVRTLTAALRKAGFSLPTDPKAAGDMLTVFDDSVVSERVIVQRFAKRGSGQEALLRYGEVPGGASTSTYALIQNGDAPVSILTVDDNGKVVTTPVETTAGSQRRGGQRSAGVAPRSADDNPYSGQADELCLECPVVCKAMGAIECGLLVLSRTSNPIAALIGSKVCEKPAEAACGPYCQSMIGPALEDDPRNCGVCGRACPGGHECCHGVCIDTRNDPQNCGACGHRCAGDTATCCNGTCVDLQTDPNFCGACGVRCTGDTDTCCGGQCVNTERDYRHCGECGSFCGGYEEQCRNGVCERPTCPPLRRCADNYCCPEGWACGGTACWKGQEWQCVPGFSLCNGQCCRRCEGSLCLNT